MFPLCTGKLTTIGKAKEADVMMKRRILYAIIGVLAVASGALAYYLYHQRQSSGIEINVDKSGISIKKK